MRPADRDCIDAVMWITKDAHRAIHPGLPADCYAAGYNAGYLAGRNKVIDRERIQREKDLAIQKQEQEYYEDQ